VRLAKMTVDKHLGPYLVAIIRADTNARSLCSKEFGFQDLNPQLWKSESLPSKLFFRFGAGLSSMQGR
jgi:hypothetical protein